MAGTRDKVEGRVKQAAGDLTDDDELEHEGSTQEFAGKTKDAIDDASEKMEDAVDDVQEKFED